MNKKFIPVSAPSLIGNEKLYVTECLDTTWISSSGKYINQFEEKFAEFCGVKEAISCCNGTVALHLALIALGIGAGDEVLIPTLTFVATANAVSYCGATPIFIDSEPQSWNLNPELIEASITPRTKAIIVVHLYGHPVEMDAVLAIARRHNLRVIEDAAEAHGAEYGGVRVGGLADIATFSFFGNKIITTGEGGMITTNDSGLASHIRQLKGQGMDPTRRYWFPMVGYNYRMTNVEAAIGLAQLEKIGWHLQRRQEVASWYKKYLKAIPEVSFQAEMSWAKHAYWMFSVMLKESVSTSRDEIMSRLYEHGIETRPVFYPMHTLPPYMNESVQNYFPVAEHIASCGMNLPTWAGLYEDDIEYICSKLLQCLV